MEWPQLANYNVNPFNDAKVKKICLDEDPIALISRLINAALVVGFCGVSSEYDEDNFLRQYNREEKVLSPSEYHSLNKHSK